jgi:hypothetical protein
MSGVIEEVGEVGELRTPARGQVTDVVAVAAHQLGADHQGVLERRVPGCGLERV